MSDSAAPVYSRPPTTSTMAVVSLSTGVIGLVLTWLCGVGVLLSFVALVTGVLARRQISASGGAKKGSGLALVGIITGALAVVLLGVILALYAAGVLHYQVRTAP